MARIQAVAVPEHRHVPPRGAMRRHPEDPKPSLVCPAPVTVGQLGAVEVGALGHLCDIGTGGQLRVNAEIGREGL